LAAALIAWATGTLHAEEPNSDAQAHPAASSADGQFTVWRAGASARGAFQSGLRHGKWTGTFVIEGTFFSQPPYEGFEGPFTSDAEFQDGQLHGLCTFHDKTLRPVCQWTFQQGQFHGRAVWWHATGQMRREAHHRDGLLDGPVTEWDRDGKVVLQESWSAGLKLTTQTTWHSPEQKRMQGSHLHAGEVVRFSFDWWAATLDASVLEQRTNDERTGRWTWWHANGQKELEGQYERDQPVGKFTWWYATGQKQREGLYAAGKQSGRWRSWHANGQKETEAVYDAGELVGPWTGWHPDGRLATSAQAPPSQTLRR
jgi:antitoxin component YwqK of YwqJK toxin-antitoxin module